MKHISILGSTGSIGVNTLNIVKLYPHKFSVTALTGNKNIDLLSEQIKEFSPKMAVVMDADAKETLEKAFPDTEILLGLEGLNAAASHAEADTVVSALVGSIGLIPTLSAINAGKTIALANKEVLVMAGELVMKAARENNVAILPVDSEHSAIFQCLDGKEPTEIEHILLTASGGPFFKTSLEDLKKVTVAQALNHPRWKMGRKVTIDSSTMMNKGLEMIEARWLFDVEAKDIKVVIHPQSIIHSMVQYCDSSTIAQLSPPDMKLPIQYALTYPDRFVNDFPRVDFATMNELNFYEPDMEKFPALRLAYESLEAGGTMPAVLNAANEAAVYKFLNEEISYTDIPKFVEEQMNNHDVISNPTLEEILQLDEEIKSRI